MPPKNGLQKIQPENPSWPKSRVPMWQGWKLLNMPIREAKMIPKNRKFLQLAVLHLSAFQQFFLKLSLAGGKNGGVSNGGVSRSGLVLPFLSFFGPFWDFPDFSGIFPICSGMVRGFSRFVLFLFLGLLRAPTRNSPERVRDTIWTFPEKSGKHPGLEPPRFSFSQ